MIASLKWRLHAAHSVVDEDNDDFLNVEKLLLKRVNIYVPNFITLFYIENDAEIFPSHYTSKVPEKGFKMAFMMNKLARIKSSEIILEKKFFFAKIHSEFYVHTILVWALYSIKYSIIILGSIIDIHFYITFSNPSPNQSA
jgi:hypothetical protein